ncbi:MAG: SDR family NAD(P)-dependent oxidoreductase, partial [Acidimicrobiia bacterium]
NEPGHIVNTTSVAGFVSRPGGGAYGASKHAVVRITEGLYFQLARMNAAVHVSLLAPGAVTTRIASAYRNQPASIAAVDGLPNTEDLDRLDRLLESHGGKDPADVAELVVQAIHAEQFYVFTDDKAQANIRTRMERILAGQNPQERR